MLKLSIKLVVSGDFDTDIFTNISGISPTRLIKKGERFSAKIPKNSNENRWEYAIPQSAPGAELNSEVARLLSYFTPQAREVAEFKMLHRINYTVLCYFEKLGGSSMPSIFLSSETLSLLGGLGFDIDVDIIET